MSVSGENDSGLCFVFLMSSLIFPRDNGLKQTFIFFKFNWFDTFASFIYVLLFFEGFGLGFTSVESGVLFSSVCTPPATFLNLS